MLPEYDGQILMTPTKNGQFDSSCYFGEGWNVYDFTEQDDADDNLLPMTTEDDEDLMMQSPFDNPRYVQMRQGVQRGLSVTE